MNNNSKKIDLKAICSLVFLFFAIFFIIDEWSYYYETINGSRIIWIGIILGHVCVITLYVIFGFDPTTTTLSKKIQALIGMIFIFCSLFFSIINFANRELSILPPFYNQFKVLDKESEKGKKGTKYFIRIQTSRDNGEWISVPDDIWFKTQKNEMIQLTIKDGYFGVPFVVGY
jgi:hypothetical protein